MPMKDVWVPEQVYYRYANDTDDTSDDTNDNIIDTYDDSTN